MKAPVRDQVNGLSSTEYFSLLAKLLKDNPPAKGDAAIIEKMATLGIEPGQPIAFDQVDPAVQRALETVAGKGIEKIKEHFKGAGERNVTIYKHLCLIEGDYVLKEIIKSSHVIALRQRGREAERQRARMRDEEDELGESRVGD